MTAYTWISCTKINDYLAKSALATSRSKVKVFLEKYRLDKQSEHLKPAVSTLVKKKHIKNATCQDIKNAIKNAICQYIKNAIKSLLPMLPITSKSKETFLLKDFLCLHFDKFPRDYGRCLRPPRTLCLSPARPSPRLPCVRAPPSSWTTLAALPSCRQILTTLISRSFCPRDTFVS